MRFDGNVCKWYLELEGRCFLNGSGCMNPFSMEGCEILCRDSHKTPIESFRHYEPYEKNMMLKKHEIKKLLELKKGDFIADWIIPYKELQDNDLDPSIAIKEAIKEVEKKFADYWFKQAVVINWFHNVEIMDGEYGIYVIGYWRAF